MARKTLRSGNAPEPVGTYSQGIAADGWLFVSGQIPIDPNTGRLVEGSFKSRVRRVFENISAILSEGGADLSDVVKTTVFLTNLDLFSEVNEVYSEYFPDEPPARAAVEVSRLPMGSEVEIECVALSRS